jgi:ABC-2 type transport system permease protein
VSPYLAVLGARFRMLLQYRAAAAAGLATQLFWGLIRLMIFDAFYRSSSAPQPMSQQEVVSYVWLGQAMLMILPWSTDHEVKGMIRSGAVAYELLRPLDLYSFWYARSLSMRTAPTLLRSIPLLLVAGLFLGLKPPLDLAAGVGWLLSTAGSIALASAITTLISISFFWTLSGDGVSRLLPAVAMVFSGLILPLPLFPGWAQAALDFLPFRGLADVPFRIYVGNIPPAQIPLCLAHQLLWTAAFVLFGRWLLSRATVRLVVQGG